jgi:hypothetical protein
VREPYYCCEEALLVVWRTASTTTTTTAAAGALVHVFFNVLGCGEFGCFVCAGEVDGWVGGEGLEEGCVGWPDGAVV